MASKGILLDTAELKQQQQQQQQQQTNQNCFSPQKLRQTS